MKTRHIVYRHIPAWNPVMKDENFSYRIENFGTGTMINTTEQRFKNHWRKTFEGETITFEKL